MRTRIPALVAAGALALSAPLAAAAGSLSLSEKTALQAAMQSHIERASVGGHFLHLDAETGEVRRLRQRDPHPVILRMGEYYVLGSSFEAPGGDTVTVDFFLAPRGDGWTVFEQRVGNRALVERLMGDGRIARVD